MPSIHFTVTAEDKNLQKVLADIEKGVQSTSEKVEKSGLDIDSVLAKITKGAAAVGVAFSAQQLVKKISDVRGEFQQLEVAFNTILGSEQKASALMAQLTETAAVTPFGLQEVAGSAKQLLAYGVAAEEVNERLVMLGDIASGLSIPLSDLAYLYGTTMTQGRMYTQDLNQFMGRGIPIADELAKQFGVTKDKVKELVTAGKIGFEEMHKSLVAMTSEGGKFGGLMEAQSKTIKGQISNLEDAIDVMFNEIGKTQEGVFNTALSTASKLVENYEEVGKILMGIVATYGAYKGALIAFTTIQKVESAIVAQAAVQKSLAALAGHKLSESQARGAAVAQLYSAAQAKVAASLKAVTAASWANPYALVTAAVVGLIAGVVLLTKRLDEQTGAYNRVKKAGEDYAGFLKTWEQNAKDLISTVQDENATNAERVRAYEQLRNVMPGLVEQYTMEELALLGVANASKEVTKQVEIADKKGREIQKRNLQKIVKDYEERIRGLRLIGRKDSAEMLENDEQYKKSKKELNDLLELEKKIGTATASATPKVKNKKYWEDMKSEAESALKDMDSKLKGTEAWNALVVKIRNADKELAKYTVKDSGKEKNQLDERYDETLSAQRENEQRQIDLLKESGQKKRQQIELNYKLELDEIAKQEREWKKAQGQLTDEQIKILEQRRKLAAQTKAKDTKSVEDEENKNAAAAMNAYLKEYGKYEEKKAAIKAEYAEKRKNAENAGDILRLDKEEEAELAALEDSVRDKTNIMSKLFEDMSKKSVEYMRSVVEEAKEMYAYLQKGIYEEVGNTGKDKFGFTKEQFNVTKNDPEKMKAIGDGIKNVEDTADEAEVAVAKLTRGFKELFKGDLDSAKLQDALRDVGEGVNQVLGAVGFLSDSLSQISDAFGGNFFGGIAEGLNVAMDAVNSTMQGAQAGAAFGPWGAAAGAAIGLVGSLTSSLSKLHDKKHEKSIQRIQGEIEDLKDDYDKLGEAIEKAYSSDASNKIKEQNELLERQKDLIEQQIAEEESKKKTDKGRIAEWEAEIDNINKKIEENKEKAIDAIFGEDLQAAINNFAEAYADALSSTEDGWESMRDTVKQMMQNMVKESIKSALQSSDAVKKIREQLLKFYEDSILTQAEQDAIYKMAEDVQKELDRRFGWSEDLFKDDASTEQKATYGGFENMSEETGSELNGRFTALQMAGEEIKNQMISSVVALNALVTSAGTGNSLLTDILTQHAITNAYLEDIVKYAKIASGFGVKLDKIVEQTKVL